MWWLLGFAVHVGLVVLTWRLAARAHRLELELLQLRGDPPRLPAAWLV